jgi:hypothetical protein
MVSLQGTRTKGKGRWDFARLGDGVDTWKYVASALAQRAASRDAPRALSLS